MMLRERIPYLLLVEVEINRAIVEISLKFLKTLKIVQPCNHSISLLGIHQGNSIAYRSAFCTAPPPHVFCCFIQNSKELESTLLSNNKCMDHRSLVHIKCNTIPL